jgi:hypothetical protein
MLRRWYYWPVFVLKNLYGIVLIIAVMIAGGSLVARSLFGAKIAVLRALAGGALMVGPAAYFGWTYRRELRKEHDDLADLNPLKVRFAADGLHTSEKSGARNFVPWSTFDGFLEGRTVFMLRNHESGHYRAIPKTTVPPTDLEQVRSAIRSRLPEIN